MSNKGYSFYKPDEKIIQEQEDDQTRIYLDHEDFNEKVYLGTFAVRGSSG